MFYVDLCLNLVDFVLDDDVGNSQFHLHISCKLMLASIVYS